MAPWPSDREGPKCQVAVPALVPGPRLLLKGFKQECPRVTLTFEKAWSVVSAGVACGEP